jgi:uncharacterized protein with HEPN domain
MRNALADKARLQHILQAVEEIEVYVSGFSTEKNLKDSKTHFATIKQLEIIGEATNHLSPELLTEFNEIEWRGIRSFRNILIHEYFNVRLLDVWETVLSDLPPLKETVKVMLQKFI